MTDCNPFAASPGWSGEQPERRHKLGIFPLFVAAAGLSVERIGISRRRRSCHRGRFTGRDRARERPLGGATGLIATQTWCRPSGCLQSPRATFQRVAPSQRVGDGNGLPCLLAVVADGADLSWRARALSSGRDAVHRLPLRRLQAGSRCDCGALMPYLKISAYRSNAGADVRDTAARARAQHRDTIKRTSGASGIEAEDQAMSEAINQFEAGCPRCAVRFAAAGQPKWV